MEIFRAVFCGEPEQRARFASDGSHYGSARFDAEAKVRDWHLGTRFQQSYFDQKMRLLENS